MGDDLDSGARSTYSLHYHLILTTMYGRGVLTEERTHFIHEVISGFTDNYGVGHLSEERDRLEHEQRTLSRKQHGSVIYEKRRRRVAECYADLRWKHRDFLH